MIYSAAWEGGDPRLFLTRLEAPGATPLAMPSALLLGVSPSAELAIGLNPPSAAFTVVPLTLAQAPLLGGAPRPTLEQVTFADWSPTGSGLAVVRVVGSRQRLEFPNEMPTGWTGDGRALFLTEGKPPRRIVRLDPVSGRRELVKEIRPSDSGLTGPALVVVTPDGRSYAANYGRASMTLFLVEGLK